MGNATERVEDFAEDVRPLLKARAVNCQVYAHTQWSDDEKKVFGRLKKWSNVI